MIFSVLFDFADTLDAMPPKHPRRRTLTLLDEALRRDVHFIDRHPTTLFQCLWNTCWWYDSPEAAGHFAPDLAGGPESGPMQQEHGSRLFEMLAYWRRTKGEEAPGFRWARSLRPPGERLGGAQRAVFRGHQNWVQGLSLSPDGRWVVTASEDGTARVWDVASGSQLACFTRHTMRVKRAAFSPDGCTIASASDDGTVRVWEAATGTELLCLRGHGGAVWAVAYSPDGQTIVSGSRDETVRFCNAITGAELSTVRCEGGWVMDLAVDQKHLVTGSQDGRIRVWDIATRTKLWEKHAGGFDIGAVALSSDGGRIAAQRIADGWVCLWDIARGESLYCDSGGDNWCVAFSHDGRFLVVGGKRVTVLDATNGQVVARFRAGPELVMSIAMSHDNRRVIAGCADGTVLVLDAAGGNTVDPLPNHTNDVVSLIFSVDGRRLASVGADRKVMVWDAASGVRIAEFDAPGTNRAESVALSPNGRQVAAGGDTFVPVIHLWNIDRAGEPMRLEGHAGGVSSLAFSPDGTRLASAGFDRSVRLWDAATGAPLACHQGDDLVVLERVAFSADGQMIVSGSWDRTGYACIWDTVRGDRIEPVEQLASSSGLPSFLLRSSQGAEQAKRNTDWQHVSEIVRIWRSASTFSRNAEQRLVDLLRRLRRDWLENDDRWLPIRGEAGFWPSELLLLLEELGNTRVDRPIMAFGLWLRMLELLEQTHGESRNLASGRVASVRVGEAETVIESFTTREAVGWYAASRPAVTGDVNITGSYVAMHSSGRSWAIAEGSHLHLFALDAS